jgi:anti-sigma factor RsiW
MTFLLTCNEFLAELNEYLDENEKIDLELRRKLERHVTECPNCWVVYDTTKKTIQVYKGMTAQTLPDEVHARLLKALEKKMAAKGGQQA